MLDKVRSRFGGWFGERVKQVKPLVHLKMKGRRG